jgi:hypothetical protein
LLFLLVFFWFCLFLLGFARLAGLDRLKISPKTRAQNRLFQAKNGLKTGCLGLTLFAKKH